MIQVPHYCQIPHPFAYPEGNSIPFEQWLFNTFKPEDETERQFLPIFWTGGYVAHKYGLDLYYIKLLQSFLDTLDKKTKMYTVVQYDDGILNDISGLDIKVYAMSGPRVDYALPLLCHPHPYTFPDVKTIFCSFVGRLTHPVRGKIVNELSNKPGYYISWQKHSTYEYCRILAASKFVLCPRGYGWNSFRIAEALQYGAMPVIISDEYIVPHPGNPIDDFVAVNIPELSICIIDDVIRLIDDKGQYSAEVCKMAYSKYFTFEANKKLIIQDLGNE